MENFYNQNGYKAKRILLVDSEKAIRNNIRSALVEEGLEVVCFSNGLSAWEELYIAESERKSDRRNFPFHLIILDAVLPGMSGLDICRFVRARRNSIPILIVSEQSCEEDKVLGLELGADDYLTKPFHLRELIARCRCLLRSYLNFLSQPSVLSFGDISLYPEEFRTEIKGNCIHLPFQEFRILQLFLKHPQQILTQTELINHIWGSDDNIHPRTLTAYINRLREKIEPNPKVPQYIKTARGKGYCLGNVEEPLKS